MTFWYGSGSGSADPYLWLMDPARIGIRMRIRILLFSPLTFKTPCIKKLIFIEKKLFRILLFEGTFTSSFKDKSKKRCHKIVEILLFCLMIEGSGSRRPKNMWIRIHNTGKNVSLRKMSVVQTFQYVMLPSCFYSLWKYTDTFETIAFLRNFICRCRQLLW